MNPLIQTPNKKKWAHPSKYLKIGHFQMTNFEQLARAEMQLFWLSNATSLIELLNTLSYAKNREEQIIETQDKPQCLVAAKATLTLTIPGCN